MRIYLTILFLIQFVSFALTPKEVIKKIAGNYNGLSSYSINLEYDLFKGYHSQEVVETQTGFFAKNGDEFYSNLFGHELVSMPEMSLTIDHNHKEIYLSETAVISPVNNSIQKALNQCTNTYVEATDNNGIRLILDYSGSLIGEYKRVEFVLTEDYWLNEITLYYAHQSDFSKSYFEHDYANSKLRIQYSNFKKKWKDKDKLIQTKRFINEDKNGQLSPSDSYSAYTIFDHRKF